MEYALDLLSLDRFSSSDVMVLLWQQTDGMSTCHVADRQ